MKNKMRQERKFFSHQSSGSVPDRKGENTFSLLNGQEEDKESGLMYYKARYYDPIIGRFLQADSVIMPESTFGMNRYMYVNGSPINFKDDTGHIPAKTWMKMAVNYYVAKEYGIAFVPKNAIQNITREAHKGRKKYLAAYMGSQMSRQMNLSPEQGAALGMYAAAGKTNIGRDMDHGARWAGRGTYGTFAEIRTGGDHTRNEDDWDKTGIGTAWQKNIIDPIKNLSFENLVIFVVGAGMFIFGAYLCIVSLGTLCGIGAPLMAMGARAMTSAFGGDTDGSSSSGGSRKDGREWTYSE